MTMSWGLGRGIGLIAGLLSGLGLAMGQSTAGQETSPLFSMAFRKWSNTVKIGVFARKGLTLAHYDYPISTGTCDSPAGFDDH
jgi:hypothetical protein